MIIRRRQILLAALVLALGAAVFVNWYYTKPEMQAAEGSPDTTSVQAQPGANLGDAKYVISTDVTQTVNQSASSEYFAGAKRKRTAAHDEAAETLNDIIKDSSSSPDAAEEASAELKKLAEALTAETDMENLISAKLGCECLVMINAGKTEIIVESGALNDVSAVQIKEIAVKYTDCDAGDVNIIEMQSE